MDGRCLALVPECGLSLMGCSLTGGWGRCCEAALTHCSIVESSVGEVQSQTDWNPVWTGPNPAVLVQVWDFPKNTGPLGPRFGHSHIA